MKLPLDNFEILGVNPGTSARDILMMLERRIEHCEYSGFAHETLQRRIRLLNNACHAIMERGKKKETDTSYRSEDLEIQSDHGMVLEKGDENAGLLLLLEAGHYEECLTIAYRFLKQGRQKIPRQANDANDTRKVIGYATLEYNEELKSKRYFDSCARVLEQGLDVVRNQTECITIEKKINQELEEIVPFRILDLVSRDVGEPTREKGIEYLQDVIKRRGGLDSESNLYIENVAFRSFFRQIRYFLTVQEQIDLYQKWCHEGCDSACFLLGISLVASGFARRKPERLLQARTVMERLQSQELDEVIDYISLLLGNININEKGTGTDEDSENGSNKESALAELCNSCREWLIRDVLEGYRDVEATADLEAYFSDRDVTSFIEDQDKDAEQRRNQHKNRLAPLEMGQWFLEKSASKHRAMQVKADGVPAGRHTAVEKINPQVAIHRHLNMSWLIGGLLLLLITISVGLVAKQKRAGNIQKSKTEESKSIEISPKRITPEASIRTTEANRRSTKLGSQEADKKELSSVLIRWFSIKQEALGSYKLPSQISDVATQEARDRLIAQVSENKMKGIRQNIDVQLKDLRIKRREKGRIEATATLIYSDKSTDREGLIIEETATHMFEKRYIFLYKQGFWVVQ